MRSITRITIDAPAERIYAIAHDTTRWPDLLPHYRFVRVLEERAGERTIEMAARRGLIPVRWTAVQRNDPRLPAIYFHHVRGWTKGMDVVWEFHEHEGRTDVAIVHDVQFRFPVAREAIEKHVVARFFIEGIAARTLACVKRAAERAQ